MKRPSSQGVIWAAGEVAFWSNEDGWGSLESATWFEADEVKGIWLPMGAGPVRFIPESEVYPSGDGRPSWDLCFTLEAPEVGYYNQVPDNVPDNFVWSIVEEDGFLIAYSGPFHVTTNLVGFVVSEEPAVDHRKSYVYGALPQQAHIKKAS
jgi:hypothetical protein